MKTIFSRLLPMAFLSALAAGCAGAWNGSEAGISVAEEHPITVDSQVVTMTMTADQASAGLSAIDKARLRAFADAYMTSGYGPLTISAPSGGLNDAAGEKRAAAISDFLNASGVDASAINSSIYRVGQDTNRDLILSYTHYVATPPVCGIWQNMRTRDYANRPSPNFGCAVQNNIAAVVADPHDLVEPTPASAPDAMARARMMQAYRAGQVTSSATDANANAQIAQ